MQDSSGSKRLPLDSIDVRILSVLQEQADLSNVDLADLVHLSASQCARRLERLRREGFIRQVVALLNPEHFGLNVLAHTSVSLRSHELQANHAFKQFIQDAPEVLECFAQAGDADFLMKVLVPTLADLNAFFERLLVATGGVADMRSGIVMNTVKRVTAIPLSR